MVDYDVLVIGAGPGGSTFAFCMAPEGDKGGGLGKKKKIGVPLQCAGLLSAKIREINDLPDEFIINKVRGAYLHSPSDHVIKVSKKETQAYVIDRVEYDKYLSQKAQDAGAEILLQHKVSNVDTSSSKVKMANTGQKVLQSKILAGCGGHCSVVSSAMNNSYNSVDAAQFLIEMKSNPLETDFVDVYVDEHISPGFIWSIPLSPHLSRLGLFGHHDYKKLNHILKNFINSNDKFQGAKVISKYHGKIPVFDLNKKIVENRAIILGDAASQVKPTTGGGLLIGFECAKFAAEAAIKSLESDDPELLKDYETSYKNKFLKELKNQLQVQKTFQELKNQELDNMFLKLKEKGAEDLISSYGDMDSQSLLVKEMIKRRILFSVLPQLLYRRMSRLWNFF
ncbi:MAG: NAD(P)/FAD-dependent oxidoreductase [Euryarchaeota archaeon]|nr:NAD(P)/FAD-dependent oxidoreductase [Euryarchaeota archaeon]